MKWDAEQLRKLDQLAWDMVACAQQPPIHPTTCAVLRLLWLRGDLGFQEICILPCSKEALRQQLARLCGQGVVQRDTLRAIGRNACSVYRMTAVGVRMMQMWETAKEAYLEKLLRRCEV